MWWKLKQDPNGFTIMELMLGAAVLLIAVAALLGAYLGRSYLNENAKNLNRSMYDARRVMETIRQQNIGCTVPTVAAPSGTSWNAWMVSQSLRTLTIPESIVVTCQNSQNPAQYCGSGAVGHAAQVSSAEWSATVATTSYDPIRVTVAVSCRQNGRVIGGSTSGPEATYKTTTGAFAPLDANANGVIDSQAMLTTLITCRPGPATSAPPPTTAGGTSPPGTTAPPGT